MRHHAFTKPEVFGASAHPGSRPAGDALHGSAASAATPPVALLGVAFDSLTLAEALQRLEAMVAARRPHYVVTANVDFLAQAREDVELHRILNDAHLVLCDGTPLVWASRLFGNALPERVAGADLVPHLLRRAARRRFRVYFLGATPEANARAVANVRAQFPGLLIAGSHAPPFRPLLEMNHEEIVARICAAQPDILLVSFGCPKAEKWIGMHYQRLGVPVTIGVGATIDFLAGRMKRAPVWMQRSGMEWLFRLCQEPRRLFRRYARDLWSCGWGLAGQAWRTWPVRGRLHGCAGGPLSQTAVSWKRIRLGARLDAETIRRSSSVWECKDRDCFLHLADVRFVDSTGAGLLLRLRKTLRATGRTLVLIAPSEPVRRALAAMRVLDCFLQARDELEARRCLAALREQPAPVVVNCAERPLRWQGEITSRNAPDVWKLTEPHLSASHSHEGTITIDLSGVPFMDTAALGLMVRAQSVAQTRGARVRFAGASPDLRKVVGRSHLESLLVEDAA
jgi:N-acetylglucosaminyldiphosphoundecaprenol N-acetyl-beta-D-mannosaminyltransferase